MSNRRKSIKARKGRLSDLGDLYSSNASVVSPRSNEELTASVSGNNSSVSNKRGRELFKRDLKAHVGVSASGEDVPEYFISSVSSIGVSPTTEAMSLEEIIMRESANGIRVDYIGGEPEFIVGDDGIEHLKENVIDSVSFDSSVEKVASSKSKKHVVSERRNTPGSDALLERLNSIKSNKLEENSEPAPIDSAEVHTLTMDTLVDIGEEEVSIRDLVEIYEDYEDIYNELEEITKDNGIEASLNISDVIVVDVVYKRIIYLDGMLITVEDVSNNIVTPKKGSVSILEHSGDKHHIVSLGVKYQVGNEVNQLYAIVEQQEELIG